MGKQANNFTMQDINNYNLLLVIRTISAMEQDKDKSFKEMQDWNVVEAFKWFDIELKETYNELDKQKIHELKRKVKSMFKSDQEWVMKVMAKFSANYTNQYVNMKLKEDIKNDNH